MTRPLEHILRDIRAEEAKISFHKTRLDRFKAELRNRHLRNRSTTMLRMETTER